ncbi:MAG TPA: alternative ribosome rescue aminoacyl-tRNA hydrolase ArfB [Microthrixaceae bacterium]|nr:alternative ribosome rescue aminoacyl-tRNA hydrolase ArfB [Microthrixaceae bacterium]
MASEDLPVRPSLIIPGAEILERFSTSGGPGGQHANKAATRVELRFDIAGSPALSEYQRDRLTAAFGSEIRVVVDDERSQLRNRAIARERLAARLRNALVPVRPRRPTRATRGSQIRRMETKRQRAQTKQTRRKPSHDD